MAESSISFNHSELKPSLALFLAFLSDFDNELAIDLRTFKPLSVLKNILAAATVAAPAKKEKKDLSTDLMTTEFLCADRKMENLMPSRKNRIRQKAENENIRLIRYTACL